MNRDIFTPVPNEANMSKTAIINYLCGHGIVAIVRADGGGDDLVRVVGERNS